MVMFMVISIIIVVIIVISIMIITEAAKEGSPPRETERAARSDFRAAFEPRSRIVCYLPCYHLRACN